MPLILLLSGPMAVGKSALAECLCSQHQFRGIKSGTYLGNIASKRGGDISRASLQELGDQLDADTDYRWVIDDVARPTLVSLPEQQRWLLDSVRKRRQVEHFRDEFGQDILHVHAVAEEDVLRRRYQERLALRIDYAGNTTYDEAIKHPNEISSRGLVSIADLVIDLSKQTAADGAQTVVKFWHKRMAT